MIQLAYLTELPVESPTRADIETFWKTILKTFEEAQKAPAPADPNILANKYGKS